MTAGGGSNRTVAGDASAKGIKEVVSVIIDDGNFTINAADDAAQSDNIVTIESGTFSLATNDDTVHANTLVTINGGRLNISKRHKGIESAVMIFNDGNINLMATNDGFNATKGNCTEANDGSCPYFNSWLEIQINSR